MVIWYLASPRSTWRTALFAIVYLMVVMIGTEIVPHAITQILVPPIRFSIPLTILWLVMLGELALVRNDRSPMAEAG
jgi:hypothetical protein